MEPFAALLDRLVLTPSRNAKLRLIADYCRTTPDPDRGYAIAAITGDLDIPAVKPAMIRALVAERMDEVLFNWSYDYVGDLAETVALVWPARPDGPAAPSPPRTGADAGASAAPAGALGAPSPGIAQRALRARDRADAQALALAGPVRSNRLHLAHVVETLKASSRAEGPRLVEAWLDQLESEGRYALLKLITGALRIGVSARLAKQALADFGAKDVAEIEELWHGLVPPYTDLFAWLEDRAPRPEQAAAAPFRPVMLATPTDTDDLARFVPAHYSAEWKWDGIRVQVTGDRGVVRLYSRSGDDISGAFPDLLAAIGFEGTLDGELLVGRAGPDGAIHVGTFSDLQQRLNRKAVNAATQKQYPVFVRAYDLLFDGAQDIRALSFAERRTRLEAFVARLDPARFDLSALVPFADWADIARLRAAPPDPIIEGIMLKRTDSAYVPGRPKGPWFKWKRDPNLIDAVLMYAQRGHGKRSSFYSDYTFGVWTGEGGEAHLVPVGKAYFGFTDEELRQIDKYVRDHTTERFGPVRAVRADAGSGLVLEVAFEGIQRSARHKSGVAMRFPRINRLRWDKPAAEADRLETLERLIDG